MIVDKVHALEAETNDNQQKDRQNSTGGRKHSALSAKILRLLSCRRCQRGNFYSACKKGGP